VSGPTDELSGVLSERASRTVIAVEVAQIIGVELPTARLVVDLFDRHVAQPLEANLRATRGSDLAKRNPMIYTTRGVADVDDWSARVLEDRETSAIEGHIGTFLEEVAIAVSGGVKPGGGVDLQIQDADGVVHLYALQTAGNTKNAGSRRSDVEALKAARRPLLASRRQVALHIAVLHGRKASGVVRAEPDIEVVGSDDFWSRVSGVADFRARLLKASIVLGRLIEAREGTEVDRIRREARFLYGTDTGALDVEALASRATGRRVLRTQE
jgi:Type II restriction endonuclease EcoO109I